MPASNKYRTIDGVTYLMRDQRPVKELRRLYLEYCTKFKTGPDFTIHRWLVERGKVYFRKR